MSLKCAKYGIRNESVSGPSLLRPFPMTKNRRKHVRKLANRKKKMRRWCWRPMNETKNGVWQIEKQRADAQKHTHVLLS